MRNFILLICLLTACAPKNHHSLENLEKAHSMFDAFNRHDWKTMSEHYTETAQFLDPSFGPEYVTKSRRETVAKYTEMQSLFSDIHDDVVGMYASGDKVTVEFISTGTSPEGTKFKLPIVSILTFENGLIVKDATYYDNF